MLTLPIQVGKRYVRRDGQAVTAQQGPGQCAYVGQGLPGPEPLEYVYMETGRVFAGELHDMPHDLVADEAPQVSGIEAQVCQDIAARQALGIAKYGCTVAENPLQHRAWLQHAYEECLDQAVYLRRAIDALDKSAV